MLCAQIILSSPALNSIWSRECSVSGKEQPLCRAGSSGTASTGSPGSEPGPHQPQPGHSHSLSPSLTAENPSPAQGAKHQQPELTVPSTPSTHQSPLLPKPVPSMGATLGICSLLHPSDNLLHPQPQETEDAKCSDPQQTQALADHTHSILFSARILQVKGRMGSVHKEVFCP